MTRVERNEYLHSEVSDTDGTNDNSTGDLKGSLDSLAHSMGLKVFSSPREDMPPIEELTKLRSEATYLSEEDLNQYDDVARLTPHPPPQLQQSNALHAPLPCSTNRDESAVQAKSSENEDRDFRLSLMENSNFDGSMVWKIPQFSQRMEDARTGKYTSIFSLPLYSARYGYKMCLRLYILGDSIGKGSHMSLFFVLMKGEFDNILQWPFTHKVTFKLINQCGGRDIVDIFQPDPLSSSFQKPKTDMNVASGCPRFVSINELTQGGFILDDTVYIKVKVDTVTTYCGHSRLGQAGPRGAVGSTYSLQCEDWHSSGHDVEALKKVITDKDSKIQHLLDKLQRVESTVQAKSSENEDRDFRLSLMENSNFDGSMVWKIPQFSQQMEDARTGKYTSIFSLPFYSACYGYKMCLRLYILGDGIGEGSHMSLFFVLMKGEFNNILQWPFTHKVTFKLINQCGGRDIVDIFQPDPLSSSFQKPNTDMNVASGCPRFVSLNELMQGGFILDDTIYIKVKVDTTTMRHP